MVPVHFRNPPDPDLGNNNVMEEKRPGSFEGS